MGKKNNRYKLGDLVYIVHPQPDIRPNTIIKGIISQIKKIKTSTEHLDYYLEEFNGTKTHYEYEVKLQSGTKINIDNKNISTDSKELAKILSGRIDEKVSSLKNIIENLRVEFDF